MSQSHECAACGGDGVVNLFNACPVCLGEGVISDKMPLADAIADAETLREVAASSSNPRRHLLRGTSVLVENIRLHAMTYTERGWEDPFWIWSVEAAEEAARAAFRACPGLRGE